MSAITPAGPAAGAWRRRMLAFAAGIAMLASGAAPAQTTDAGTYRATGELNIRAAPGTDAAILGVIPPSGRVAVSSCDSFGWCQVRYENIDGWAARQLLVRTGDLPADAFTLRFGPPETTPATAGGMVELTGRITPGTPCAFLRTDDGGGMALLGNVPFAPDEELRVLGAEIATEACGTATALAVLHIRIER